MADIKLAVIAGPTASGKTALSIRLAQQFGGEVFSADSMQLYKGFDIGTAKPDLQEQAGVPHHFLSILPTDAAFSTAQYQQMALAGAKDACARGVLPVFCGGTGLYIQSVLYDLRFAGVPRGGAREKWEALLAEKGPAFIFEQLEKKNPQAAARLHPNDHKRVVRALEIAEEGGDCQPSEWFSPRPGLTFSYIVLNMRRELLYERINKRAEIMFERGLWEEVAALLESGVPATAQAMQAIGYKEVAVCLQQGLPKEEAMRLVAQNTRRYAKRQLTWFARIPGAHFLDVTDMPFLEAAEKAAEILQKDLNI